MRIAVVGTGISGLATAWMLSKKYDVRVFEKSDRLGGHSNTVRIDYDDTPLNVDTGFIVYNERNYPNLVSMFDHLGVATETSNMSFSASIDGGRIEYAGSALSTLFAQKRNLFRPSFLYMLKDFSRFCRLGKAALQRGANESETLGQFLDNHAFTKGFRHYYLLPMAASIWSAPCAQILDYPSSSFLRFFANHGLLDIGRHPQWRTVKGGSANYVKRLAAPLSGRIERGNDVRSVRRVAGGVEIVDGHGHVREFDHVVLACHADQCLDLLEANGRESLGFGGARINQQ
ncbi:MAG: FAD-dependent oxidoreductase, partial [Pseudomonadota bacterium]